MAGWSDIASSILGAAVGGIGSNAAAQAQQDAAWQANQAARRNLLMQAAINEPLRYSGYQALNDINNFFGYQTPAYTNSQQVATSQTPLGRKTVTNLIKRGYTVDQIAQMGTLNAGKKTINKLIKAGLSLDQIKQLQTGIAGSAAAQTPTGTGTTGQTQQQPAGGENWNALFNSPDYQFVRNEGERNMGNAFAARGGAASGNALRALEQWRQGLASQQIDNFLNRRLGMIGYGQNATQAVGGAGNTYSRDYQQNTQAAGDARASGIQGVTGSIQGGIAGIFGALGQQPAAPANSMYGPYASGYRLPAPLPQTPTPTKFNLGDYLAGVV